MPAGGRRRTAGVTRRIPLHAARGRGILSEGRKGVEITPQPARSHETEVRVPADGVLLAGDLTVPEHPLGVVLFAHGSGSSRRSPRNRFVGGVLNEAGLATLLFDLLTPAEEQDRANVFDVKLLADRLAAATRWLHELPPVAGLPVCYFGASTGAAAALGAAASLDLPVTAIVSRGGRPDLAGSCLPSVRSPVLLVVGGRDEMVLELNREAAAHLSCEKELVVVPGATHLFEEPGTLERVAELACDWFLRHLDAGRARAGEPASSEGRNAR